MNIKKKIKILKKMRKYIKNADVFMMFGKLTSSGFCRAYMSATDDDSVYDDSSCLFKLGLIKPAKPFGSNFWYDSTDKESRIQAIDNAISHLKSIKK